MKTRREFLAVTGVGVLSAAAGADTVLSAHEGGIGSAVAEHIAAHTHTQEPAGMPPAFGTAKPAGPVVSVETFAEAEKVVQVELNKRDREQLAQTWRVNMAPLYERRAGPRKMPLPDWLAPWSRWDPVMPGTQAGPEQNRVVRSNAEAGPLPSDDADIAFATVTLDKLGPMTRGVEDALLVLQAISGPDAGDVNSVPSKLDFDASASVKGLRVGYFPAWMKENPATEVDRTSLETVKRIGMIPVEVSLPDWPYDSLQLILFAEGAAAFEELTLQHGVDQLKMQTYDSWPNLFRQARFLSAVDFVQADRMRRKVAEEMARIFSEADLLLVPSLRDEMLTISNFTGHPSLTLRAGFVEVPQARSDWAPDPANPLPKFTPARRVPHGVTLIGKLFEEGILAQVGLALEKSFGVAQERPRGF